MTPPDYASGTERVDAWLDGATLQVRFNNPARHNALSVDMWGALPPLLRQARMFSNCEMSAPETKAFSPAPENTTSRTRSSSRA
jgi:hypothetical protein